MMMKGPMLICCNVSFHLPWTMKNCFFNCNGIFVLTFMCFLN